jgi:DDE superfamily endonuclease
MRGKELTEVDKFFNKLISSVRIVVENVICGVKRCRIVKDILRLTKENISDVVMEIACGLHNLRVTFRQPLQTLDITDISEILYFK